ncbi:MAG: PAS domain-containing protein [Bacteroidota bacterium]
MSKAPQTYFPLLCGPEFLPASAVQRQSRMSGSDEIYELSRENDWQLTLDLEAYLSKPGIAIVVTDTYEQIEWVNSGFTYMTGYKLSEIRGVKPAQILQGKGTSPKTKGNIRVNLDKHAFFSDQILNYRKNGEAYWCKLDIWPLFNSNNELVNYVAFEKEVWNNDLHYHSSVLSS